jgi:hypothetical protein
MRAVRGEKTMIKKQLGWIVETATEARQASRDDLWYRRQLAIDVVSPHEEISVSAVLSA